MITAPQHPSTSTGRPQPPDIVWVKPNQLIVDRSVQRAFDGVRAAGIAADFSVDEVGVIHVSERADGTLHTIDGQHRMGAARIAGFGNHAFPAMRWRGLTKAQEAAKFRVLNNTRKVQPLDLYLVRIMEGDPVAVALNAMLESHGWIVRKSGASSSFYAVTSLERAYKTRPGGDMDTCDSVVKIATDAWGHNSNGLRKEIIDGMAAFLVEYPQCDKQKLTNELKQTEGGPLGLIGRAKGLKAVRGGQLRDAMAEILVTMHNRKLQKNRLAQWGSGN